MQEAYGSYIPSHKFNHFPNHKANRGHKANPNPNPQLL